MSDIEIESLPQDEQTINLETAAPQSSPVTPAKKRLTKDGILNICLIVLSVLCITTILLRMFVFVQIEVKQTSMMPTYVEGERVWVDKTAKVVRGTVVVFYEEDHDYSIFDSFVDNAKKLIKRVAAVAGDKIWVEKQTDDSYIVKIWCADTEQTVDENYYTKNGVPVVIPNILLRAAGDTYAPLGNLRNYDSLQNAFIVPEDCFYAMGDNRNVSNDSRNFGAVPVNRIVGVAID